MHDCAELYPSTKSAVNIWLACGLAIQRDTKSTAHVNVAHRKAVFCSQIILCQCYTVVDAENAKEKTESEERLDRRVCIGKWRAACDKPVMKRWGRPKPRSLMQAPPSAFEKFDLPLPSR